MPSNVVTIIIAVVTIIVIGEMVRRKKMLEKYAVLWITVGVGTLLFAVFPDILIFFSTLMGIQVSSNLLLALYIILILAICLHLSWELSSTEDKIRNLTEEVALLRDALDHVNSQASEEPNNE